MDVKQFGTLVNWITCTGTGRGGSLSVGIDAHLYVDLALHCLVGKVLTKKKFHVQTFKDTVRALWGGQEGMQVLDMGFKLFHFIFNDATEMARVLQGEPWLFDGYAILLGPWKVGLQTDQYTLECLPCWVQVWNLPLEFVDAKMDRAVGAHIGTVIEVEERSIIQAKNEDDM
ncbi:hypothetical protein LIER_40026 [Lithospermum erythrorhizon]|uniref:DUF4283 domain-containing protein n=1 Tax=Lithospermum erythrorhizon TaxID=34254 RepID=A0AAV3QRY7_LITER